MYTTHLIPTMQTKLFEFLSLKIVLRLANNLMKYLQFPHHSLKFNQKLDR